MAGPAARPDLKAAMRAALEKKQRVAAKDTSVAGGDAASLRKEGNQLFAANDLAGAEQRYREALSCEGTGAGRSILWSNLALLRICSGGWQEGLDFATKALVEDTQNVKAQYRRALCGCELGRVDQAMQDVENALQRLDTSTPEGAQAADLKARLELVRGQGSPRSSIHTEDWELCGKSPLETPPPEQDGPDGPALRAAYAEPARAAYTAYDSTTAIPTGSDYHRAASGQDRYIRTDRVPDADDVLVALDKIASEIGAENAWPLNPDEDVAPPKGAEVRQIGVVPSVPEPEGADDDDAESDEEADDLEKAKALLAFCEWKREKDPLMERWRARWGD